MFQSHMRFCLTQWSATRFYSSLSVYSRPLPSEKIAPWCCKLSLYANESCGEHAIFFGSQIEKAHLQFCKRYLEVNKKASNIACRAELGRFSLNITTNQKILKYILYIQSEDDESLVKQAFLRSR